MRFGRSGDGWARFWGSLARIADQVWRLSRTMVQRGNLCREKLRAVSGSVSAGGGCFVCGWSFGWCTGFVCALGSHSLPVPACDGVGGVQRWALGICDGGGRTVERWDDVDDRVLSTPRFVGGMGYLFGCDIRLGAGPGQCHRRTSDRFSGFFGYMALDLAGCFECQPCGDLCCASGDCSRDAVFERWV